MNKFVIIIALTILLKPVLPVIGYVINYDYIVIELCENRDNKALNCNGKCQLKKELAKASDSGERNTGDKKIKITQQEILFFNDIVEVLFSKVKNTTYAVADDYYNLYSYSKSSCIFHPPLLY